MASQQDIVTANTHFALDLFHALPRDGNLFFSPLSISAALALTLLGAKGPTESSMKQTMHISEDMVDFHKAFRDVVDVLNRAADGFSLRMANRLYGAEGYNFLHDFTNACKSLYGAEFETLDFKNVTASLKTINGWVEKHTQGKVKDLIQDGVLKAETMLVLVNAIHFKGDWTTAFDRKKTKTSEFHVTENEKIDVQMMFQDARFSLGHSEELQCSILELPYGQKKELSMFILLPFDGLASLEAALTEDALAKVKSELYKTKVNVYIPKFQFDSEFDLGDILTKLGMGELFSRGAADLSGMDGTKQLYISKAVHKAFVDVNEEGTEAAGATGMVANSYSMPPQFVADRPFLFFIEETGTGSVLFMGRVQKPQYAN
jgi:serpin B